MKTFRKFPIGIQSFEDLIRSGYIYVDKTELIFDLVNLGKTYFLSRPRRFGKSLLISTLEAYFLGKKELFKGLAMEHLETEWTEYPVFHIDLSGEKYKTTEDLERLLNDYLCRWEEIFGTSNSETSLSLRFKGIIRRACEQTGKGVVVLIDEYDKPLLEAIGNEDLSKDYRGILRGFYGVLKPSDQYLKFVFLTGVTKFGQMTVFSDLNQPKDISMSSRYDTLCGITNEEINNYFDEDIKSMSVKLGITYEEVVGKLRVQYDGYHFSQEMRGVYNPFSLLNVFSESRFSNYWFQTGTPSYLLKLLKRTDFDISSLESIRLTDSEFGDYRAEIEKPIPMIYQSGYLTIKAYNSVRDLYTLGFPNEEVRDGFLRLASPQYLHVEPEKCNMAVDYFLDELYGNKMDAFMTRFKSFVSSIDYKLFDDKLKERYFQIIFYLTFRLIGAQVDCEVHTSEGSIDAVIKTLTHIYIFEFKMDKTPEAALRQIEEKHYTAPYLSDSRPIVKIGVNYSSENHSIEKWMIVDEKS